MQVLRDGDDVPGVAGYLGQTSVAEFVADYIGDDGKISLAGNQSIYLFELGSTNPSSSAFDMQDLVVLLNMTANPPLLTCTSGSSSPVLDFNISSGAEILYSPEAVAKLGKKIESIRLASKVVVTEQRSKIITPEEKVYETEGGVYGN